jgi:hypothetical protein
VGGYINVVSRLTGGKFGNGAVTAAIQYVVNAASLSLKELGRKTLWDRVQEGYDSEFLSNFKKVSPYEYASFKKYALTIDAKLWNESSAGWELEANALRGFSRYAVTEANNYFANAAIKQAKGAVDLGSTVSGKLRSKVLSTIGAWPVVDTLIGDYQMARGAMGYVSNIEEVINIQAQGPQWMNRGLVDDIYGSN